MEEIRDFLEWVGGDQQEGICVFSRGSAPTGQVGGTIRDAPRRVSAVSLRVSEALAALALHGPFGATYDSTDTRRPQSSVI